MEEPVLSVAKEWKGLIFQPSPFSLRFTFHVSRFIYLIMLCLGMSIRNRTFHDLNFYKGGEHHEAASLHHLHAYLIMFRLGMSIGNAESPRFGAGVE